VDVGEQAQAHGRLLWRPGARVWTAPARGSIDIIMPYFLQFHNAEKLGWVPLDARPFLQTQLAIYTRKPAVLKAVGATVFVIVGAGKRGGKKNPRRYYLWECFEVAEVRREGNDFCAWGPGWQLVPPARLDGDDFTAFRRACAWFVGFRAIDGLPYTATLAELARQRRGRPLDATVERFCCELVAALPASGDVRYARGWVRQQLGLDALAIEDLDGARALGTEFADEARACRLLAAGTR
jgi:hypothetical protein